jgi:TonB family protein
MKRAIQRAALLAAGVLIAGPLGAFAQGHPSAQASPKETCEKSGSVSILSVIPDTELPLVTDRYLPVLIRRIRKQWYPIIPSNARSPKYQKGCVLIEFTLAADGIVSSQVLVASSGDVGLDRAAWDAIKAAAPYPAFPEGVSVQQIKLAMAFQYNENPTTNSK